MLIIIDKTTNKITQTISENYGVEVANNEAIQEVSDDFINKYNTAHTYNLVFTDGIVTDITVIQTIANYENSLPPVILPPTEASRLSALEEMMSILI